MSREFLNCCRYNYLEEFLKTTDAWAPCVEVIILWVQNGKWVQNFCSPPGDAKGQLGARIADEGVGAHCSLQRLPLHISGGRVLSWVLRPMNGAGDGRVRGGTFLPGRCSLGRSRGREGGGQGAVNSPAESHLLFFLVWRQAHGLTCASSFTLNFLAKERTPKAAVLQFSWAAHEIKPGAAVP